MARVHLDEQERVRDRRSPSGEDSTLMLITTSAVLSWKLSDLRSRINVPLPASVCRSVADVQSTSCSVTHEETHV